MVEPIAIPRQEMNDKLGREEPQFLLMNNSRIWIFYKRNGDAKGNWSYVVRAPQSDIFTREQILPMHVSRVSFAFNNFNGNSILSIFHGLSNDSREFRHYTENNGITWKGEEEKHGKDVRYLLDKIVAAGNGQNDGYIAYGELTIYYMKFDKDWFTRVEFPPLPKLHSARILTTSYRRTKFWFAVMEDKKFDLWVISNNLEEAIRKKQRFNELTYDTIIKS